MGIGLQIFKGFMRIVFALGIVLAIVSIIQESDSYWAGFIAAVLTSSGAVFGWLDFDKLN